MRDGLLIVLAYLLGSVSFSYLIVRRLVGLDIRGLGSGNAGATNVFRTTGKLAGLATFALDLAKGAGAVLLALWLSGRPMAVAGASLAVVLGHCFPVFLRFRGGKGVATAAGVAAVLAPLALILALGLFVLVVRWTDFVAIGSLVATAATPLLAWLLSGLGWIDPEPAWEISTLGLLALLIVWTHRVNLRRLIDRTEARLSEDARVSRKEEG